MCWTTTTGTPAAVAPSITRRMLSRWAWGWVTGSRPPSKYSFCTSITSRARFISPSPFDDSRQGRDSSRGRPGPDHRHHRKPSTRIPARKVRSRFCPIFHCMHGEYRVASDECFVWGSKDETWWFRRQGSPSRGWRTIEDSPEHEQRASAEPVLLRRPDADGRGCG